jgi:hypothetical protein
MDVVKERSRTLNSDNITTTVEVGEIKDGYIMLSVSEGGEETGAEIIKISTSERQDN